MKKDESFEKNKSNIKTGGKKPPKKYSTLIFTRRDHKIKNKFTIQTEGEKGQTTKKKTQAPFRI